MKDISVEIARTGAAEKGWTSVFSDLVKARLTTLVLLTTAVGFYLGWRGNMNWLLLFNTLAGTALVAAGASALNQWLERDYYAKMLRTQNRPLPSGRMQPATVALFGGATSVAGLVYLAMAANPLTSVLGAVTLVSYVFIYTPLKRVTTMATFIGAFPGAMGPLLGWTAARGRIEWPAVALFAILFVWQFPHFMAIAWLYREDYARAGIRMLPVVQPDGWSTVLEALFYAVLMIPVSLEPWRLGMAGVTYAVIASVLGLVYLGYTIRFARILKARSETESRMLARDLLKVSVLYLPLLFTALMLCATGKR